MFCLLSQCWWQRSQERKKKGKRVNKRIQKCYEGKNVYKIIKKERTKESVWKYYERKCMKVLQKKGKAYGSRKKEANNPTNKQTKKVGKHNVRKCMEKRKREKYRNVKKVCNILIKQ